MASGISGRCGVWSGVEEHCGSCQTRAVKISIEDGQPAAIGVDLLAKAVDEEFMETQDAVLDADPEQWSRINGLDAGHVTSIRQVA